MERSIHIWRYGGCQSAGTLSAGGRIEGAELSADPDRKRSTVFLLSDLSEVETPVPASGSGAGMPGADQSCGEWKGRQSGAERRLSGDHRQCLAGCCA